MDAKRLSLTLFTVVCLSLAGFAQEQLPTLVFQLTSEQAEQIYQGNFDHIQPENIGLPIDSFYLSQNEQPRTPGHYLYVAPDLEEVKLYIESYHSFQVNLRNNDRDLALEITNQQGQTPMNAVVHLDKKQIPYDPTTKTYRLRHQLKGGFLRITIGNEVAFYDVTEALVKPLLFRRFQYWRGSRVGYWLTTPIRWTENTYHYFRRGIRRGNWHWYHSPFEFLRGKERHFRGYIALNQPKYRPGDTLQLKAYLTNHKAKPWKRPVSLRIAAYSPFHGRQIELTDTILQSADAGHFNYTQLLSDSLPLDLHYSISFDHPRKERFEYFTHSFRLEDYELDEAEFSLTMEQDAFHRGETIRFQAAGKDQNEQYVADAEVELLLLTSSIKAIYQDSLSVPDTLWSSRESLRNTENTPLFIPDSVLPPADLELELEANFIHPSGELHRKHATFTFLHHWDELVLKLEGDSILMDYQLNGQSVAQKAFIQRYSVDHPTVILQADTVQLPHREAIQPHIRSYNLRIQDRSKQLDLGDEYSLVDVMGHWQPDTLTVIFQNPRRLPITWLLQSRTREIRRSVFTDTQGEIKVPVSDRAEWKLSYEYFWQKPISEEAYINRLDKQLTIEVEQPPRVNPGETVPVRVQVKDPYGEPAAAVQLTAAAVNSQFGKTKDAYRAPNITYKRKRAPFVFQNFRLEDFSWQHEDRRMMDEAWYKKIGSPVVPFYQMRFQNEGIWTKTDTLTQDSFYANIAQIAPYLINNGKALPIYLIYINEALVYYHGTQDSKPYSFAGRPGYNTLSLRTRTAEFRLDSVWLEPGQKLELAINMNRFSFGTRREGIRLSGIRKPEYLTQSEKQFLRKSMLALKPQQQGVHYFWDRTMNVHAVSLSNFYPNRSQEVILGPFAANAVLHHVRQNHWERQLTFEPGFIYDIDKNRERLYAWNKWLGQETIDLPKTLPLLQPGGYLLRPDDIVRELPFMPRISFDKSSRTRISGKGRLQLFNRPFGRDSLEILAQVLVYETGTEQVYQPANSIFGDLPVGNYLLFLVRADGRVSRHEAYITANATLALDLTQRSFISDDLRSWPDRLFSYSQMRRMEREKEENTTTTVRPYPGTGRWVRGQITDSTGEPLIGVNVLVQGTTIGTVTDFDGYYEVWLPSGSSELVVNYIGFNSTELVVDGATAEANLVLGESLQALDEVVVVGYGTSRKQNLTGAVSTVLEGRAAGVAVTTVDGEVIRLRGSSAVGGTEPLIIIDGQIVSAEELSKIPPGLIEEATVVKDAATRALYGARAAAGVLIIKLREDGLMALPEPEPLDPATSLRDDFRDYAFWQPHLITDENGEAFFQATFPDNITAWDTYVLGMDRRQRAGIGLARTQAWKSLVARLNVPRFLIAGDEADMIGQAINYDADSLQIQTFFQQDGMEVARRQHSLESSLLEHHRFSAAADQDSLTIAYGLTTDDKSDGEQRDIPIFPKGSMETTGFFVVMNGDTSLELRFDRQEPITIYAADNALQLFLHDLKYLQDYPQACMEQTASRLIAFCLDKKIRQQLGQPFEDERGIRKMVDRLEKAQHPEGSWGWWPGNPASHWITIHVLKALQLAGRDEHQTSAYQKGLRYLVNELPRMEAGQQLIALDFLSSQQHPMDYDQLLRAQDTMRLNLHDRLLTQLIRQRMEIDITLDTLYLYRQQTLYGAYFWGDQHRYFGPGHVGESSFATSLLAYEMLKNAGKKQEAAHARQYFLERRGIGRQQGRPGWYNTYETARVLGAIIPDLLSDQGNFIGNSLRLRTKGVDRTIDVFPYQVTEPMADQLQVTKIGTSPLYFTAYQQYHEPKPQPRSDVFRINSRMLQDEREVMELKKSHPVFLEVSLETTTDAEYIMLEIPIPAGCSFGNRSEHRNRWEVHREYQREKVVLFCEKLPTGKHTFTVQLEPRFTGLFTLNPARAEQMYFPVLFGRNATRQLEISP